MKRSHSAVIPVMLPILAAIICAAPPIETIAEAERSPCVALTFDDGPCPETTEALLDGLKERNIHATFFLIGEQIAGQEDTVRRMKAEGHQIGNHTYSHIRLDRAGDNGVAELAKEDALLRELLGDGEYWIRPPWGFIGDRGKQAAGVPMVCWSVDTADWQCRSSDVIVRCITEHAQDGDIILLHDIYPESVDAALRAVDALCAQGYEFVTVKELFERENIEPELGRLYARPDMLITW